MYLELQYKKTVPDSVFSRCKNAVQNGVLER
jgi:hypothetical protein